MAPPAESHSASKTYSGGCHCGANRFTTILSPPLDDPQSTVSSCNCSVCSKNGYYFVYTRNADTKWEKGGLNDMTGYTFNQEKIKHHFCPTCGTSVVCSSNKEDFYPDILAFNVGLTSESSKFSANIRLPGSCFRRCRPREAQPEEG